MMRKKEELKMIRKFIINNLTNTFLIRKSGVYYTKIIISISETDTIYIICYTNYRNDNNY